MKIDDLKEDLKRNSIYRVVNKYILANAPVCFNGDLDLILELKEALARHFDVHVKEIEIVGSAKLGISLSEERFGKPYCRQSDIDLVLVSSQLFDRAWHDLLGLDRVHYRLIEKDRELLKECYNTIHRGFISPERLPADSSFGKWWWHIFSAVSSKSKYENREIRGRLFKSWWFAEEYYSIQLAKLSKTGG